MSRHPRREAFFVESSAVQTARTYARELGVPFYVMPAGRGRRRSFFVASAQEYPSRTPPYTKVHPDGRAVIHTASRLDPKKPSAISPKRSARRHDPQAVRFGNIRWAHEGEAVRGARHMARHHGTPFYVYERFGHWHATFDHPGEAPYTKVHPDGRAVVHTTSRFDPKRRTAFSRQRTAKRGRKEHR